MLNLQTNRKNAPPLGGIVVQSTPDNSNLQGKLKKSLSYRGLKENSQK